MMPRSAATLGVALLFVLVATTATFAPSMAAAQVGTDAAIAEIDAFWAGTFAEAGRSYSSPGVVGVDDAVATECGTFGAWIIGGYCPLDGTIYYSAQAARDLEATGDGFAWVTILAHEWGHHAQWLLGLGGPPTRDLELQADCLAGAYANAAAAGGLIDTGELTEAVAVAAESGDASWLPEDAPGAHGSGPERATAFMRGYVGGVGNCDLAL